MAALQFPANPAVGQIYDSNDYSYSFDGTKWTSVRRTISNVFSTEADLVARLSLRIGDYVKVVENNADYVIVSSIEDGILLDNGFRAQMQICSNTQTQLSGILGKTLLGNLVDYEGSSFDDPDALLQYPSNSGVWYGPATHAVLPIVVPADPEADFDWARFEIVGTKEFQDALDRIAALEAAAP